MKTPRSFTWFFSSAVLCALPACGPQEPEAEVASSGEKPAGDAAAEHATPKTPQFEDWTRFGGPNRDNTSNEPLPNIQWGPEGPKVLWEIELNEGFGGAAVDSGEVFVADRTFGEADVLLCLDAETGAEKWRYTFENPGRLPHPGSRGTATVTDDSVYFTGGFGEVRRISRETHEPVWTVAIQEKYETQPPKWGYAQSPLLVDDVVIIAPMSETVGLAGLNKDTGEEMWRTEGFGDSHSTPVLLELQGVPQVVFLAQKNKEAGTTISVDPASGTVLWKTDAYLNTIPITPPTKIDEERVFLTGGYECGSVMLKVTKAGDAWKTEKLWDITQGTQIHQPLLQDNHIYMLANENANHNGDARETGGLMCLDYDGNVKWHTGNDPFMGRGNSLMVGGLLFIQDGENGVLRVVDPDPAGYKLVAEADVFGKLAETAHAEPDKKGRRPDFKYWSPMALSHGRLYMRGQDVLKCLDLAPDQT